MTRVPVLRKRCVYHVGDPAAPPRRADFSFEGPGLSVSEHPEEWSRIARLGAGETHALRRLDRKPGVFVDMLRRGKWRAELEEEAVDAGLLTQETRFAVDYWDDEAEEEMTQTFVSLEEAESEGYEGEVYERDVLVATEPLVREHWSHRFSAPLDDAIAPDMAVLYLLSLTGKYDGAWWNEELAPEIYSAPRGVIFESKLAEWDVERGGEC
jgi:hypothetical protein